MDGRNGPSPERLVFLSVAGSNMTGADYFMLVIIVVLIAFLIGAPND